MRKSLLTFGMAGLLALTGCAKEENKEGRPYLKPDVVSVGELDQRFVGKLIDITGFPTTPNDEGEIVLSAFHSWFVVTGNYGERQEVRGTSEEVTKILNQRETAYQAIQFNGRSDKNDARILGEYLGDHKIKGHQIEIDGRLYDLR
jgi:hypothetical protein